MLASCSDNTQSYAPAAAASSAFPRHSERPDTTITCRAPQYPVPGKYVMLLVTTGVLKGESYSTGPSSYWIEETLAPRAAASEAVPEPSGTQPPTYQYPGEYHLQALKQTGCMVLVTTLNLRPFPGGRTNAKTVGAPLVKGSYTSTVVSQGSMSIVISNLTPAGGTGELILRNGDHSIFDTGTIALKARTEVP